MRTLSIFPLVVPPPPPPPPSLLKSWPWWQIKSWWWQIFNWDNGTDDMIKITNERKTLQLECGDPIVHDTHRQSRQTDIGEKYVLEWMNHALCARNKQSNRNVCRILTLHFHIHMDEYTRIGYDACGFTFKRLSICLLVAGYVSIPFWIKFYAVANSKQQTTTTTTAARVEKSHHLENMSTCIGMRIAYVGYN